MKNESNFTHKIPKTSNSSLIARESKIREHHCYLLGIGENDDNYDDYLYQSASAFKLE